MKTCAISLFQINVNRQIIASSIINREANDKKIDVVLVQEPYVHNNSYCFRGRRIIAQYGSKRKPSAITVIKTSIKSINLPESNQWLVCTKIMTNRTEPILIVNAYLSPSSNINHRLAYIGSVLSKYRSIPTLLCGDFNCRSAIFGDIKTTKRGKSLELFVHNNGLTLINNSKSPTFTSSSGCSLIDLMFVNLAATKNLENTNWKLHDAYLTTSDHNLISFTVNLPVKCLNSVHEDDTYSYIEPLSNVNYRSLTKDDLEQLFATLDPPSEDTNSAEELVQCLTRQMQSKILNSRLISKTSNRSSSLIDWWNEELEATRKDVLTSRKRFQQCQSDNRTTLRRLYSNKLKHYRHQIKLAKQEAWRKLCETADLWSQPYKFALRKTKTTTQLDFIVRNGRFIYETDEIIAEIQRKFFPPDDQANETSQQILVRNRNACFEASASLRNESEHLTVNESEVTQAIAKLNKRKCPGLDGLTTLAIEAYSTCHMNSIIKLINKIFKDLYVPASLKTSKVILIEKSGKSTKDVDGFRPITLVSSMSKLIEHILLSKLHCNTDVMKQISERQYGFSRGKTVNHLHSDIISKIKQHESNKKKCAIVSMDISGAFDCAWHPNIIARLHDYKCPEHLVKLIRSYLENRTALISIHNKNREIKTARGCPQGSVLGPSLWNISINHLLLKSYRNADIYAYADDFYLLIAVDHPREFPTIIQNNIEQFMQDLNDIKLTLNLNKTKFMAIGRKPSGIIISVTVSILNQVKT